MALEISKNIDLLWFAEIYNMAKRSNCKAFMTVDEDTYQRIATLIMEDMKQEVSNE